MSRKHWSQVGLVVFILIALTGSLAQQLRASAAEILATAISAPSWLSAEPARVAKTGDLHTNTVPYSKSLDCNEKTITDPVYRYALTNCSISTGAGPIVNGKYTDDTHTIGSVFDGFLQSYGESQLVYLYDSGKTLIYPALTKSQLVFNNSANLPGYNYIPSAPYRFLTSTSGSPIYLDTFNMAYSNNGQWLVAIVMTPQTSGLMVFDTKSYTGKFIAPLSTYAEIFSGNNTPGSSNLAISDDGRYVAAGYTQPNQNSKEKGLRVYDTTTCTDQYAAPVATRAYCSYKNVWTGKLGGITKTSVGIQEQLQQTVERPLNIRFKDVNTITFSGVYDYISMTNMKAATYEATMLPAPPPPIKLLALGDSYISGEGAFSYISGTDTSNNKCHQSSLSYPYLLGAQYADEYHSLACSGALTTDIMDSTDDYKNQLIPKVQQGQYLDQQIKQYLLSFTPGYLNQLQFVTQIKPNTILLSIGGNDIGFNKIVKWCVLSIVGNPCYSKRSERLSLLKTIYGEHERLTDTYRKILSESASWTKLYVIGYPQVVNSSGDCGVNVHLDDQERQFASLLIDEFNKTLKNAAESAGAIYVDTSSSLVGHRLCDNNDNGVNGLTAGNDTTIAIPIHIGAFYFYYDLGIGNESYHPTEQGHQLLANTIAAATDNLTKKPKTATNTKGLAASGSEEFVTSGVLDEAEVRKIVFDAISSNPVVTKNQELNITVGAGGGAAPNTDYTVVMHTQEVTLATGITDANGNISKTVTIPDIEPGVHSLHIYTTDIKGEPIDITDDVFIIASADDVDGDGINNADDTLPFINETDHIIVPEEPSNNDQGTNNSQQPPASGTQDTANSVITKTDAPQLQSVVATDIKKSALLDTAVVTTVESNTPKVSQALTEVLGVSDTQKSVPARTAVDKKSSRATIPYGIKPMIILGFLIVVITAATVVDIKHKRSKRQSAKI